MVDITAGAALARQSGIRDFLQQRMPVVRRVEDHRTRRDAVLQRLSAEFGKNQALALSSSVLLAVQEPMVRLEGLDNSTLLGSLIGVGALVGSGIICALVDDHAIRQIAKTPRQSLREFGLT